MANGQTRFGNGFERDRFVMAPIVEGLPPGTVPGEAGPRLGQGGFSNVRPPEKPPVPDEVVELASAASPELEELLNMDPRQVAKKAGDAFFGLVFSAQAQFRDFKSGQAPRFGETMRLLLPQIQQAAKVYGDAREEAGLDRATADRALAKFEDSIPQVPITSITQKPGERTTFLEKTQAGFRETGLVENPPLPTVVPQGGTLAETRIGRVLTRGQPTPRKADTQVVKARDKDGNIFNVLVDKRDGTVIGPIGPVGPETSFVVPRVPGVGREELAKLDEAEIGSRQSIQGAFKLRQAVLEGGPSVLAAPGVLSGLAQGFVSQTLGFAQLIGVDIDSFESGASAEDAGSKADSIFAEIDRAGTINAEIRSAIVNLAFAAAAASGQTGRGVSDRDYERFVRELGAGASKPAVFASVLTKFAQRQGDNFSTRFKVKMRRIPGRGQETPPDLFKEIFGVSGASAAPAAGDQSRRASSLPEGTTATNSATGEKLIVRGGKWVSQ